MQEGISSDSNMEENSHDADEPHQDHEEQTESQLNDPQESLPPDIKDTPPKLTVLEEIYDQFEIEDLDDYQCEKISDHYFKNGTLILKASYFVNNNVLDTIKFLFSILKKDVPIELAQYIREKVIENRRGGIYNTCAKGVLNNHNRCIRRLFWSYNINYISKIYRDQVNFHNKLQPSWNKHNAMKRYREKFDIKISNNVRETLALDKTNKDTQWADVITKEMKGLD